MFSKPTQDVVLLQLPLLERCRFCHCLSPWQGQRGSTPSVLRCLFREKTSSPVATAFPWIWLVAIRRACFNVEIDAALTLRFGLGNGSHLSCTLRFG